ncbi:MAG: hypothetical protein WA988_11235, partial [Candidatus Nanopelagicales bacterium]
MSRAGLFIGVDRTGDLPLLRDAAAGAARMHQWALQQGISDQTRAKLITDAGGGKVTPLEIFDAVQAITRGGADQLIMYFAGHGVNINRGEQWLLSDAPANPNAAVNVAGSVELARYCGIQHVVIISDACRVAAEGIRAQNIRGSDVFANPGTFGRSKPVDQFYACYLGRTAAEIKSPKRAAQTYSALYTDAVLDALTGSIPDVLEDGDESDESFGYVRPRTLQRYLEIEVPLRVRELGLTKVNQNPDAIITSDKTWLSRVRPGPRPVEPGNPLPERTGSPAAIVLDTANVGQIARELVPQVTARAGRPMRQLADAGDATPGSDALIDTAQRNAVPFEPPIGFEASCGFQVRGARLIGAFARRADLDVLTDDHRAVRVIHVDGPAASVLLTFEGGFGTVVPAVPGFIAGLTVEGRELVDIAYEPSRSSDRWDRYRGTADNIRALRALAAAAAEHGRFSLDTADAGTVAQTMQYAKSIDPTLAVYAAYAYHELQQSDRITQMVHAQRDDWGATFFDIALLAGNLAGTSINPAVGVFPFVPLLSQGWALLNAHRITQPAALNGIE